MKLNITQAKTCCCVLALDSAWHASFMCVLCMTQLKATVLSLNNPGFRQLSACK